MVPSAFNVALLLAVAPAGQLAATPLFQDGFEPLAVFGALTPVITVGAGTTGTYCYHFRSPAAAVAVRSVTVTLGNGVAHAIVYSTHGNDGSSLERRPAGTLATGCGIDEGPGPAGWIHAAHAPVSTLTIPNDDGGGTPLAIELGAGQALVLQVRVANPSGAPLQTDAAVLFDLLPEGQEYVPTSTYRGTHLSFSIPAASTGSAQGSCAVPAGARFWRFTTRTHRLGVGTSIKDGSDTIVAGTDWEDPPVFDAAIPFRSFQSGAMTYACSWSNTTGATVWAGSSEDTDEACMGVGYFFPAAGPLICLDSTGPL